MQWIKQPEARGDAEDQNIVHHSSHVYRVARVGNIGESVAFTVNDRVFDVLSRGRKSETIRSSGGEARSGQTSPSAKL
jgi:hypothetical protein